MKKYLSFLILAGFNSLVHAQDSLKFINLYGDYLDMSPPGDTPAKDVFMPSGKILNNTCHY